MKFNYTFEKKQMLCTLWAVLASLLMPLGAWAQTVPNLEDGYYLIRNADELIWFSTQVNNGSTKIKGKLTADIDLDGKNFTPIGNTNTKAYAGHFNGQFHRIKNMHLTGTNELGFIRFAGKGCIIEGVIIDSTCSVTSTGYPGQWVGGVVGQSPDATGSITIINCGNEANITGKELVGGIYGGMRGNADKKSNVTISNCYNTGTITATDDHCYAIAGYVGNGKAVLSNCWNSGKTIPKNGKKLFHKIISVPLKSGR